MRLLVMLGSVDCLTRPTLVSTLSTLRLLLLLLLLLNLLPSRAPVGQTRRSGDWLGPPSLLNLAATTFVKTRSPISTYLATLSMSGWVCGCVDVRCWCADTHTHTHTFSSLRPLVCCHQIDVGVCGDKFNAGASPSLADLIRNAARNVSHPAGGTLYDHWLADQRADGGAPLRTRVRFPSLSRFAFGLMALSRWLHAPV